MSSDGSKFRFGGFTADIGQRTCSNGAPVDLTWRAFEALRLLLEARGQVVDKETFFKALWPGVAVEESSLAKCIGALRKSLNQGGSADYIETVTRVGYRLAVPVEEVRAEPAAADVTAQTAPPVRRRWWLWAALGLSAAAAAFAWSVTSARMDRIARARVFYAEGQKLAGINRPENFPAAVDAYRQAIQLNPNEANYHASLAEIMGRLPRGPAFDPGVIRQAAERSVELDPRCAGCQAVLGFVLFHQDWEWERAGQHMRRAIELDPEHPGKRGYLAMQLASQGRLDEALAEVDRGIAIQPYQATLHNIRSAVLCGLRRFPDSIAAADRAISFRRARDSAWDWRAYSQFALDRPREGVMSYVHRLFDAEAAEVEKVLSRSGLEGGLRWLLDKTESETVRAGRAVNRAHWKLLLGDREGAIEELNAAEKIRHFELVYLAVNPAFDPLRDHPGFRGILSRMKLEHALP